MCPQRRSHIPFSFKPSFVTPCFAFVLRVNHSLFPLLSFLKEASKSLATASTFAIVFYSLCFNLTGTYLSHRAIQNTIIRIFGKKRRILLVKSLIPMILISVRFFYTTEVYPYKTSIT